MLPIHSRNPVDAAANYSDPTLHACPSVLHMELQNHLSGQWASVAVDRPMTKAEYDQRGYDEGERFGLPIFLLFLFNFSLLSLKAC